MLIAAQAALTHYCWHPEVLGGIAVEVMQLVSVFGVTTIACMMFPYIKKVRHIWDASPYKAWRIGKVPVATIAGCVGLILVIMLVYAFYTSEGLAFMHDVWTAIYIIAWLLGIGWYFIWKSKRAKEGIDVSLAFKEIPPE